jgi:hypothetical protein
MKNHAESDQPKIADLGCGVILVAPWSVNPVPIRIDSRVHALQGQQARLVDSGYPASFMVMNNQSYSSI